MPGAGKAYWTACQWRPGVRAGKHTAVSDSAGLFVIFSEVKTDCRRLLLWKILAEIMMEKIQQCKNVQFKWKLTWKHCRLHYVISESKITDSKSKTVTNIFNIAHM